MTTHSDLEKRKAALTAEQRAELDRRIKGTSQRQREGIQPVSREEVLPLSSAQERIWLHQQLHPSSIAYNRPAPIRLRGQLKTEPLRQALNEIVRRHESLRTTVAMHDGQPVQRIQPVRPLELPLTDVSAEPNPAQRAWEFAAQECRRPFDLERGPLLRTHLIRIRPDEHLLLLTFHHFTFDAWSQSVLIRELASHYEAFAVGLTPASIQLPIQYGDFAAWERRAEHTSRLETARACWKQELADPPTLQLPTDFAPPRQPSEEAGRVEINLSSSLVARLRQLARSEQTTLFTTLLSAFTTLLHRYSEQNDIVVGCPVAGRTCVETEDLIGVFINVLPIRTHLYEEPIFRRLLRQTQQKTVEALKHQHVPFQQIVQDVLTHRDRTSSPLFQAMFVYENLPLEPVTAAGLRFESEDLDAGVTLVDVCLELMESADAINGHISFRREMWKAESIQRLADHFLTLLDAAVADADCPIFELPMLSDAERHRLLVDWNNTAADYPHDKCVHELFEEQVRRTPDAIAVICQDRQLTYRELNERADQLAHHLYELGVTPDTIIGLCLHPSPELLIGILGILKSGGAYLPLDPSYPRQRLTFMLQDAAVRVLVTQQNLLGNVPSADHRTVCLDKDNKSLLHQVANNGRGSIRPNHLAYAIYTSGSTGKPKGVLVNHGSLANYVTWARRAYDVDRNSTFALSSSVTFDLTVTSIYVPLVSGGKIVVFGQKSKGSRDQPAILEAVEDLRINTLKLTPAGLSLLMHRDIGQSQIRKLIVGGEDLLANVAQTIHEAFGGRATIYNEYGPTEATVGCVAHQYSWRADKSGSVPIGRPIANMQAYVLDGRRAPCPIGVPGELYIGGVGLARGYLNDPEPTEERFVDNPFDVGRRLYRSGDRVRWRSDATLEFLGRYDDQVKLRGLRIELGEIETTLGEHGGIAQCVVLLREDRPGDKRLVAYWVPAVNSDVTGTQLREHLKMKLPELMVPSAFVQLDSLPLNANGKVDRKSLPAPGDPSRSLDADYSPPRDALEEQLAAIWSEVLGVGHIGVHDDFFQLGGHSLLAMQLVVRAQTLFDVHLPVRDLFEFPTVADLAKRIATLRVNGPKESALVIRREGPDENDTTQLSFGQQRLWFLDQLEDHLLAYNMPSAWRLQGSLDVEALRRALETVVRRHESLRSVFREHGGQPYQVIQPPGRFEMPQHNLGDLPEEHRESKVARLMRQEAEQPFDLTQDLLLRATLLRLSHTEYVLLLTQHHIASDGWSQQVLWRELKSLYEAYRRGQPSPLTALPIQYSDYACWQRERLERPTRDRLVHYWREQLDDLTPLELPTDRPRPPKPSYQGADCSFRLNTDLVRRLCDVSRHNGATLQMTLLAAFHVLVARYSGQQDISLGVPVAGRLASELEPLIGFFVNTLVMRADLSGEPTFRELLQRVRETSLAAYDHQELPFEMLVEELQPERQLSRNPMVQVVFQLVPFTPTPASLHDIKLTRLHSPSSRTRADLMMHLVEVNGALQGVLRYSTDLFDAGTIERMAGHYRTLLEGIVADPNQRIWQLPILPVDERGQILVKWNDTAGEYPREKCIHQLFEEQVERTPDKVAVVFEDEQLTYRQLNAQANQIAHHLQLIGVGPEVLIGLYVERSVEMVVGLLGILKAGAAYVPLDPAYPKERLAVMLDDAQVTAVLTQQRLLERLPEQKTRVVCLDADWELISTRSGENPEVQLKAHHLAYVLYTSGSTGLPQGVEVEHRGIVNMVSFRISNLDRDDLKVVPLTASICFDGSVIQLFVTLCSGGKLLVVEDLMALPTSRHANEITYLNSTPSNLETFLDEFAIPRSVRVVFVGGEPVSDTLVQKVHANANVRKLINPYGPTEATVYCSTAVLFNRTSEDENDHRGTSPRLEQPVITIGKPIQNLQLYVLDRHLQPVPIGVPGELYIGGDGLARGYLNRPNLTAERFIRNPFSRNAGSRLFKTGDMARYRADGNIEFLGRCDHQVKIRGFRIELGEIEASLAQHPHLEKAVVLAREDTPGDKRLVAYAVPIDEHAPSMEELRHYLRSRLPTYMIPSAFVFLKALPVTPNGKVDSGALPAPDASRPELDTRYVAPRNPVEESLARIWCEVLGLKQVGIHDDFFELGGHSLLATRVIARTGSTFRVELPLRSLFELPTIAGLADTLIEQETTPGQMFAIARLRQKLDSLSPDEIHKLLHENARQ